MTTALSLPPDTELLESLLWQPGQGYFLLERHLERLQQSAKVLGFPCSVQHVRATLLDLEVCFTTPRKVRLLLDDRGLMHMNSEPLKPSTPVRAALAVQAVSRDELLLRHKTTARGIYTDALA